MGLYKREIKRKDRHGHWKTIKCEIENIPHDLGFWMRNNELEKKDNTCKSYIDIDTTRTGMNKKVSRISTYFFDSPEKDVRTLITTSNKLSKRDSEKYKNISNCKYFSIEK